MMFKACPNYLHTFVDVSQPFLEEYASHPGFLVVAVEKAQSLSCLALKTPRLFGVSNEERREFVGSISVCRESNCDARLE